MPVFSSTRHTTARLAEGSGRGRTTSDALSMNSPGHRRVIHDSTCPGLQIREAFHIRRATGKQASAPRVRPWPCPSVDQWSSTAGFSASGPDGEQLRPTSRHVVTGRGTAGSPRSMSRPAGSNSSAIAGPPLSRPGGHVQTDEWHRHLGVDSVRRRRRPRCGTAEQATARSLVSSPIVRGSPARPRSAPPRLVRASSSSHRYLPSSLTMRGTRTMGRKSPHEITALNL